MSNDSFCDSKLDESNPLIEALPEKTDPKSIINMLFDEPQSPEKVRQFSDIDRLSHIKSIPFCFHYPLDEDVQVATEVDFRLRVGYTYRNPLRRGCSGVGGYIGPRVGFVVITGISGLGKTANINMVLRHYKQVVVHPGHDGKTLSQIIWMKLNCLSGWKDPSTELCIQFMNGLDSVMNTHFAEKGNIHKSGIQSKVMCLIDEYNLGMLIVDDIQNLVNGSDNKGLFAVLNFLIAANESCGVPIVLIGTPNMLQPLSTTFRLLNKLSDSYIAYDRIEYNSPEWNGFMDFLWRIQYTDVLTESSDALYRRFYDLSQGIPSVLVNLFTNVQLFAMMAGKRSFDETDVALVAKNGIDLIKHAINAMKCNYESILQNYVDLSSKTVTDFTTDFSIHPVTPSSKAESDKQEKSLTSTVISALIVLGLSLEQAKDYVAKAVAELGKDPKGKLTPSMISGMAYDMYKADQASEKEGHPNNVSRLQMPGDYEGFRSKDFIDEEASAI